MKRRELLLSSAAIAGSAMLPRIVYADENRIDMYTGSDSNISDFWSNTIKPAFEAENPGVTINVVIAREGGGTLAIAERAMAAMSNGADPLLDFIEQFDPHLPAGAIDKGLWTDFTKADLSNYSKVNPLAIQTPYGLPYRGSQVLLAYDTTKVAATDVPKTWAELTAWIKANPGQFVYNRPDKGGSGGNFVRRAIWEANGRDPSLFKIDNFEKAKADEMLGKGFDILKDLAPYLYQKGSYSSGNSQSIQLLSQGVVTMIPAWSDMALQALNQGVLPETIGLVQLTDLAFAGGFSRAVVPTNARNHALDLKLANFLLTPKIQSAVITEIGGFPGVSWEYVDPALREKYKDVVPASIPTFPGGDWESAINDGWYRTVAPNLSRS